MSKRGRPVDTKALNKTFSALAAAGWNQREAAKALGIGYPTMASRVRRLREAGFDVKTSREAKGTAKAVSYDPAAYREKLEERREKSIVKDLEKKLFVAEERTQLLLAVQEESEGEKVGVIKPYTRRGKRVATAVALASDWHVEEEVDPKKIQGCNEYNLEIARERIARFFQGVEWKIRHHLNDYDILNLLLALAGDFISGYIHPELMETNQLSPAKAIVFCKARIIEGIDMLLKAFPELHITLPCVAGNHGRTTEKTPVSTRMENSFEWMMYHMLEEHYAAKGEKRVDFQIAAGAHAYVDVMGWMIRITHGDDIRYQGGVGGLSIPLRKACDAWDQTIKADYTLFGHWHQKCDFEFAIGNGSLIGYAPYAQWVKARYEAPSQQFFLIDAERGKDYVSPIWVSNQAKRNLED